MIDFVQLADGSRVCTQTGQVMKEDDEEEVVVIPSATEAIRAVERVNKRISDLPVPPKQMNVVSLVMSYSLFGLSDNDIGIAIGLSIEQIGRIKMSDAYGDVRETIVENIIESDAEAVRTMFTDASKGAVNKLIEIANKADDKTALGAVNSILDRAGHRPADVQEHRLIADGGLKIEFIQRKDEELPAIDITPENH